MSDQRRSHERVRRNADRVRDRLAATLARSRSATARDERTNERARVRADSEIGAEPIPVQTIDA